MNLEQLRNQKQSLEAEKEAGKAQFFRAEGALAIIEHLIKLAEEPEKSDDKPAKRKKAEEPA